MSDTKPQIQTFQRTPSRTNVKKLLIDISSKCRKSKVKKEYQKKPEGKNHLICRETKIRITSNFSQTTQPGRGWSEIFKLLTE